MEESGGDIYVLKIKSAIYAKYIKNGTRRIINRILDLDPILFPLFIK